MSDRLREALEWWKSHPEIDETTAQLHWFNSIPIVAAARRWLALTETGPDYEAAMVVYANQRPGVGPVTDRKRVRAIVDAALADYLTEEETEWNVE